MARSQKSGDQDDNDDNGIDSSAPVTLAFGTEPTNDGNGSASNLTVDFGISDPPPTVAVSKTLLTPEPVAVGANLTFAIRVTNIGYETVTFLPLRDTYDTTYLAYDSLIAFFIQALNGLNLTD